MSRIRPLERGDLPEVASLYESVVRSGARTPPPLLSAYFERTLLDHPWADPDIPSLVYEDDGRILAFLGSHVRRLSFDGRPIRMAVPGQFVADREHPHKAAGALLMRRYLSGPQDITIAEGEAPIRFMWEKLGGVALQPACVSWTRHLRPARALGDELLERARRERWKPVARPIWALVDAAATRRLRVLRVSDPSHQREPLTPEALLEHLPSVLRETRVVPDYSEAFLHWLFSEMAAVRTRGTLARCLVRDHDHVLGWYISYLQPDGIGQVMQIAAADSDMPAVLDHLFHHAQSSGTAALEGRLDARLFEPLAGRRCVLRYGTRVLAHSQAPELLRAVALGQSFVTRMDGEWWMGHHRERFR